MGRVSITCCGETIYWNHETRGGQSGTARCPSCGCSYGWADLGEKRTKTWTEQCCPDHGEDSEKVVLCERCKGSGYKYTAANETCPICKGSGLLVLPQARGGRRKRKLEF